MIVSEELHANVKKNVNVVEVIKNLGEKRYPKDEDGNLLEDEMKDYLNGMTNDGNDNYTKDEGPHTAYPRDPREHYPLEVINSEKIKPTNDGVDTYVETEPYVEIPRDAREHNPIDVINTDETKPVDGEDIIYRLNKLTQTTL